MPDSGSVCSHSGRDNNVIMERNMRICIVALFLIVGVAWAYDNEDYRRALQILRDLKDSSKRRLVDCKALGEECSGVIPCCGETQCYWKNGYSTFRDGECIKCVAEGKKCQRDSQCCSEFQCDKGNALWTDGTCERYRRKGECYRDGQCVSDCVKSWYKTHGKCT